MDSSKKLIDDFEIYAQFTRERNWEAIQALNGSNLDGFGVKKEIKVISEYLEEGEVVFALSSGIMSQTTTSNMTDSGANTWLVLLTSERFLFIDAAFFGSSIDTQSVRHRMVQAVSGSQGWIFGKISIDLGSRLIVVDNCQKKDVKIMADLANKWLREIEQRESKSSTTAPQDSPLDKLAKLQELHAAGALSDEEFSTIKEKILAEM